MNDKINYRKYPIFKKLENGSLGKIPILLNDAICLNIELKDYFNKGFANSSRDFMSSINFVDKSFYDFSSQPEETGVKSEIIKIFTGLSERSIQGTWVYGDFVFMIDTCLEMDDEYFKANFYAFEPSGRPLLFTNYSTKGDREVRWISSYTNRYLSAGMVRDMNESINFYLTRIIIFEMTKNHKDVKCKKVKAMTGNNKTNLDLNFYSI